MTRSDSPQNSLHEITQDALKFRQTLGLPPSFATKSKPSLSPRHYLTIPTPQPITTSLIECGLDAIAAEKLNSIYLQRALSLKHLYEDKHRQAIQMSLDLAAFHAEDMDEFILASMRTITSRYHQGLSDWRSKIEEACRGHSSIREQSSLRRGMQTQVMSVQRRPTFRNESVPLLEKAFHVNAYPNRADKVSLAVETEMEYKQINVWFQNRRARSKKEGVPLQRVATFFTQLHILSPTPSMSPEPHFAETDEVEPPATGHDSSSHHEQTDPFPFISRPVYAFPTTYPPLLEDVMVVMRTSSFSTPWLRDRTHLIRRASVDLEQLATQMASLSLSSDTTDYKLPLPSFTLTLPRAPLPALIRTVTTSSYAQPVATLVSAPGSSPALISKKSKTLYRGLPCRLSTENQVAARSSFSVASSWPIPIPISPISVPRRSRCSETRSRSPFPSQSSRSSSLSSTVSSRSSSSSWSSASSIGPVTPISTSPHIEALSFTKDVVPSSTSPHVHRSSSISDAVYIASSLR